MTTIKGKLEPFFETGTEGVIWSVFEDGKEGYDGLHTLHDGDYLVVFDPMDPLKLVWEGNISLEWERNYRPYPMNPQYGQQEIGGLWVHGIQENVTPEDWGRWFYKGYPCELMKGSVGRISPVKKSSIVAGYSYTGYRSYRANVVDTPGDLVIKFKNAEYYRYKDVPNDAFEDFYEADSKGKYFAAHIKNKFVTEKIELPTRAKYGLNVPNPWSKYPTDHGLDELPYRSFPLGNKP